MSELDFAIVDPHIHQWEPSTTPRAVSPLTKVFGRWPNAYRKVADTVMPRAAKDFVGGDSVLFPYLPSTYANDMAGVSIDTVVHVEAGWHDHSLLGPVGETRWLEALPFESTGHALGAIVAHADLRNPRVDEALAAHAAASSKLRGIRHMASHHPDAGVMRWSKTPHLFQEAEFLRGFEKLTARKLRFDAWVYSTQLPDVASLAQRFPDTAIVLDHVGTPVGAAGPVAGAGGNAEQRASIVGRWRDDLARVAEHKNVRVKLSGLAMPVVGFGFHTRATPPSIDELTEAFRPFVSHAIAVFGVERAFFASNFPMDKASAPGSHIFGAYIRLARELGEHAPRALLRDNALQFYGV
jgi:predicted TIM-barrel fold metal-dependent hydrolase